MSYSANPAQTAQPQFGPAAQQSLPATLVKPPQPGMMTSNSAAPAQQNVFQQSSQALNNGIGAVNSAMAYRPSNVQSQNVAAGQLSNTNLNSYMNPYTQNVINRSMSALDRARQMTMNDVGAQATAANAFGGSRHGIVEAETNRGFADQAGQMASQLNMQNFQNAQQMGQFDINNNMQAGIANQNASLQSQMANQQAQQSAASNQLNAAGMYGNLSQMGFNMGNTINQQQSQQGLQQQAMMQQLIDAAKNQWAGYAGAPANALTLPMAAVGGANMGQQTQTTSQQPGLFNYLSLGASMF